MSSITRCDICKKRVKFEDHVRTIGGPIEGGDFCLACWKNEKKWPKIHKVAKKFSD